ncbi:hypothetical protein UT300005_07090 [Clostridium sp. CTA-5]
MREFNCCPNVLLRGCVYYEDMTPVIDALVILETVLSKKETIYTNYKSQNKGDFYCISSTTNSFGEFCFPIFDINHYYKIKIFENNQIKSLESKKVFIEI